MKECHIIKPAMSPTTFTSYTNGCLIDEKCSWRRRLS